MCVSSNFRCRPNEKEISHSTSLKTLRRECVSGQTRIALGKPGTWMEIQGAVASSLKLLRNGAVGFIDWLDVFSDGVLGKYPITIRGLLTAKDANKPLNALAVSVGNNERVKTDLALNLGDPITNVLDVGSEK